MHFLTTPHGTGSFFVSNPFFFEKIMLLDLCNPWYICRLRTQYPSRGPPLASRMVYDAYIISMSEFPAFKLQVLDVLDAYQFQRD
jgi:hypothetical protein